MDITVAPHVEELAKQTRRFIRDVVMPVEAQLGGVVHDGPDEARRSLQRQAKEAGLLSPHVGEDWGGRGLDVRGQSVVFEEAGYSLLGPLAMNCAAPDEGNMHLLEVVASEEQKQRYLRPLAGGEIRSCFAMTEPAPGAGSDPAMLSTTATRVDGGWRIDGRKWFITGAHGAGFAICMARTSGSPGERGGATMFLVDADNPGMRVVRDIDTLDEAQFGGHSEIVFENCVVTEDAVLGEVDRGFAYAQVRLAPARLTHCMRWLGVARRAHDIAVDWAATRKAFGGILGELGMVQQLIADNEIDIAASRALIRHTAAVLDSGERGGTESSIAKTFVAEAVNRVVDRAVQVCGALGVSGDVLLSRYLREVRPFRIYDGPSEVHRWAIGRRAISQRRKAIEAGEQPRWSKPER
ncbi:MAG TPA: acyl-CoA dehydrogenase family protein [Kribbellaceae bacterium]